MSEPLGPGHGAASDLAGSGTCGFMYSLACDNGAFDKDQPPFSLPGRNIAQDLLTIEDGGMIGVIAYGRWGWVATSHYLQRYFFDSLFAHPNLPAVDAMYASHAAYPYCRDLILGQLYLGDPAVRVYTEQPRHLVGDVTIVDGEFRARFTDRDGVPAAGMMVLLSDSTGPLDQMVTDLEGWVSLPAGLGLGHMYHLAMRDEGTTAAVFDFVPGLVTDVADEPTIRPERFALHQNYPNPFNPMTTIAFDLERRAHAQLVIYNVLGQRVAELVDDELEAGAHEVVWDGRDRSGATVASGVYFYRLESGVKACSRKMMLLK
ncbi:T9SS type A sorting domain-containing protein, partial [candidate division GN15 bacterium]|nr:T9SS type A sorting domain-containing protein [candidate division GN15 bacterium]